MQIEIFLSVPFEALVLRSRIRKLLPISAILLASTTCWLCVSLSELSVEHESLYSKHVSLRRTALLHSQQLEELFKESYRLGALQSDESMPLQDAWARFDRQMLRVTESDLILHAERALVHRRLANIYLLQERWSEATVAFSCALGLIEKLSKEFPTAASYRQEMTDICIELARTYAAQSRLSKADEYSRRAHSILVSLPPNYLQEIEIQSRLSAIYQCMVDLKLARSDISSAAEYLSLVVELLTRISNSQPADPRAAYSAGQAHRSSVELLVQSGQETQLRKAIRQASEFFELCTQRFEGDQLLHSMQLKLREIAAPY